MHLWRYILLRYAQRSACCRTTFVALIALLVGAAPTGVIHARAGPALPCGGTTVIPSPNVGTKLNNLYGAAAISANDIWTVGYDYPYKGGPQALIEQWDGTSWNTIANPPGGGYSGLYGATRVPDIDQLWAVGYHTNTQLIEQTLILRYC